MVVLILSLNEKRAGKKTWCVYIQGGKCFLSTKPLSSLIQPNPISVMFFPPLELSPDFVHIVVPQLGKTLASYVWRLNKWRRTLPQQRETCFPLLSKKHPFCRRLATYELWQTIRYATSSRNICAIYQRKTIYHSFFMLIQIKWYVIILFYLNLNKHWPKIYSTSVC